MRQSFITGIVLIAGSGERFSSLIPKQFHKLSGKSLYLYTLETFLQSKLFNEIILVCHLDWITTVTDQIKPYCTIFPNVSIKVIAGGKTRQASSYIGIKKAKGSHVLIHDGVRPFVSEQILRANISALSNHSAINTCINSPDTIIKKKDPYLVDFIPNRQEYRLGQTPQSFEKNLLLRAHKQALLEGKTNATDDCQLVLDVKEPVFFVEGSETNIKITSSLDLFFAEQLLKSKTFRLSGCPNHTLENKTYVVTGATGGIGRELCQLLKKEKASVIELSLSSKQHPVDLTNFKQTFDVFQGLKTKYTAFDGLINCIGFLKVSPFHKLSHEEINSLIASNFTAVTYTCRLCPLKKTSHIINLASSSFSRGRKDYAVYSSMKAALVNFSQALAEEHPDLCINALVPSRTNTAMRKKNFPSEELSTLLSPETVARKILDVLKTSSVTGMSIEI